MYEDVSECSDDCCEDVVVVIVIVIVDVDVDDNGVIGSRC